MSAPAAAIQYQDGRFLLLVQGASGEVRKTELDQRAVQALLFTASKALGAQKADPTGDSLMQPPMIDAKPIGLTTGSDGDGLLVLTVEMPLMPPIRFRFDDEEARTIVTGFRETLDTPMGVRLSMKAN